METTTYRNSPKGLGIMKRKFKLPIVPDGCDGYDCNEYEEEIEYERDAENIHCNMWSDLD
jgi:hypothetical protein